VALQPETNHLCATRPSFNPTTMVQFRTSEACQPTCYLLTPTIIFQILFVAIRSLPLRIFNFLLAFIHALILKLVVLVINPKVPCSEPQEGRSDGEGKGRVQAEAEAAAKADAEGWAGVRRLGGITLTITVLVGKIRLVVVTVTIVALTLWVPFYPSARSFFSLCDRFCRTGTNGVGSGGFAVDIRMGA
jgi:hypothetical protein